jgi:hypothetical protein
MREVRMASAPSTASGAEQCANPDGVEAHLLGEHGLLDRLVEAIALLAAVPGAGHFDLEQQIEPEGHRGAA